MKEMKDTVDDLIDLTPKQLSDRLMECEICIENLRKEIANVYEKAQPYLLQIRVMKKNYAELTKQLEAVKTFVLLSKDGSLISKVDKKERSKLPNFEEDSDSATSEPPPVEEKRKLSEKKVVKNSEKSEKPSIKKPLVSKTLRAPPSPRKKLTLNWMGDSGPVSKKF
jgi:predicted nucleotidyltransferase